MEKIFFACSLSLTPYLDLFLPAHPYLLDAEEWSNHYLFKNWKYFLCVILEEHLKNFQAQNKFKFLIFTSLLNQIYEYIITETWIYISVYIYIVLQEKHHSSELLSCDLDRYLKVRFFCA